VVLDYTPDVPETAPSDLALQFLQSIDTGLAPETDNETFLRIRDDPFWFSREALGNHVVWPEDLEGDWGKLYNFIWGMGTDWQYGQLNSPRNSYKTTIICAKCTHLIVLDRNIRILYITNNRRNAKRVSGVVRRYLEANEIILEACPPFVPTGKVKGEATTWTEDQFFVAGRTTEAKEATFTISTSGTAMAGGHFDIVIVDDGVDEENSKTRDSLQGTIDWYRLLPKLQEPKSKYGPGGVVFNCGTIYDDGDLHMWLRGMIPDSESPWDDYTHLILKAMENPECWDAKLRKFVDPILNFPHTLNERKLTQEYKNGSSDFYKQYQNECRDAANQIFRKEQFKIIQSYDVPSVLTKYVLTDYAMGTDNKNDRTAIWVVGLDWKRNAYCLDFVVGRWGLDERIKRTVLFAQKYDAAAISVEQMMANEGVLDGLAKEVDRRRLRVRIVPIGGRSTESKHSRICALQPRLERQTHEDGCIFFVTRDQTDTTGIPKAFLNWDRDGVATGEIVHEFVRFPKAVHDDIPDALSDIDKRDTKAQAYLFPEPSRYLQYDPIASTQQRMSWSNNPTIQNGRIIGSPQAQQPVQDSEDTYTWAAKQLRRR